LALQRRTRGDALTDVVQQLAPAVELREPLRKGPTCPAHSRIAMHRRDNHCALAGSRASFLMPRGPVADASIPSSICQPSVISHRDMTGLPSWAYPPSAASAVASRPLTKDKSCSQIADARAVRMACRFANLTAFERSVMPGVSVSLQKAFRNDGLLQIPANSVSSVASSCPAIRPLERSLSPSADGFADHQPERAR
jgi:hypothetical protein